MALKWEVTIREFRDNGVRFKVTRRLPEMCVAETFFFDSLEDARKQVVLWLE
ncbi:MAG TPA: hypothetical protein VJB87_04430 [Candidatus Nanoarchaeia archaeon]|nr:hypothetical protein [Candidatus Nanoarchaeia archaeon]